VFIFGIVHDVHVPAVSCLRGSLGSVHSSLATLKFRSYQGLFTSVGLGSIASSVMNLPSVLFILAGGTGGYRVILEQ